MTPIEEEIQALMAQNASYKDIAAKLKDRGYKTPNGKPINTGWVQLKVFHMRKKGFIPKSTEKRNLALVEVASQVEASREPLTGHYDLIPPRLRTLTRSDIVLSVIASSEINEEEKKAVINTLIKS